MKNRVNKKYSMLPFFVSFFFYFFSFFVSVVCIHISTGGFQGVLFSSPLSVCVLLLRNVDEVSRNFSLVAAEVVIVNL